MNLVIRILLVSTCSLRLPVYVASSGLSQGRYIALWNKEFLMDQLVFYRYNIVYAGKQISMSDIAICHADAIFAG
jgi:hypothetical protein